MKSNTKKKRELWEKRICAYRKSNQSARIWCENNQVNYHTLKYWIAKINNENKSEKNTKKEPKQWIKVNQPIPSKINKNQSIQINIGDYEIIVQKNFDQNTLKGVVGVLKQC